MMLAAAHPCCFGTQSYRNYRTSTHSHTLTHCATLHQYTGMTLSTTANWLCNFAIGRLTPTILRPSVFNLWGTFLFFGAFCVGMVFLTLLYVPETALVALEDIDAVVAKFRKLSPMHRMTKVNLVVDPAKTATSSPSQMEMSKTVFNGQSNGQQAAPVV
jgi:Sugar (and other) transporter